MQKTPLQLTCDILKCTFSVTCLGWQERVTSLLDEESRRGAREQKRRAKHTFSLQALMRGGGRGGW